MRIDKLYIYCNGKPVGSRLVVGLNGYWRSHIAGDLPLELQVSVPGNQVKVGLADEKVLERFGKSLAQCGRPQGSIILEILYGNGLYLRRYRYSRKRIIAGSGHQQAREEGPQQEPFYVQAFLQNNYN